MTEVRWTTVLYIDFRVRWRGKQTIKSVTVAVHAITTLLYIVAGSGSGIGDASQSVIRW